MKLKAWLRKHNVTYGTFAKRVKSSVPSVSRWCSEKDPVVPDPVTIALIEDETDHAVTLRDFVGQ